MKIIVIVLISIVDYVLSYRVKGSKDENNTFVPYEKGFVGEKDSASMSNPPRFNQGFDSIDYSLFEPNRLQTCPGMIGPGENNRYYCASQDHGDCDRRSGVCFCNRGYAGEDCSECAPTFHLIGGLCYEKKLCPNHCSNAGKCNYFTGACECNEFRIEDDCSKFTCSRFHEYCVKCNDDSCLECIQGFGLSSDGSCRSCSHFDPRCHVCDEHQCLECIDLLLLSIHRSGRRITDPELPFDEVTRQLSYEIPFGSQQADAFDEAEYYYIAPSDMTPLHASAIECDQGTNLDSSFSCRPATISNKICGHDGVFRFSSPEYFVLEDEGHIRLTVERSGGGVGSANVSYALNHITTGSKFLDMSPTAMYTMDQTLHFSKHEIRKSFLIPIHNDILNEGNETFQVFLHNPTGNSSLGTQSRAIVTIVDNDAPESYCCGDMAYISLEDRENKSNHFVVHYDWCDLRHNCKVPLFHFRGIDRHSDDETSMVFNVTNIETSIFIPGITDIQNVDIEVHRLGTGLVGFYFSEDIPSQSSHLFSRVDATVNFTLTHEAGSSMLWKGFVRKPHGKGSCCTFHIQSKSIRFWIDGFLVIDEWHIFDTEDTNKTTHSAYHDLQEDFFHEILLQVKQSNTVAAKLMWDAQNTVDVIPSNYLFGLSPEEIEIHSK